MDYIITKHEEDNQLDHNHDFYESTFVPKRILWDGSLSPAKLFEAGVVKIQRNQVADLTDEEKEAVSSLLKPNCNIVDEEIGGRNNDDYDSFDELDNQENVARRYGPNQEDLRYVNCDFIFGSCAEVERLWSVAKFVLTDERKGKMSPVVFEAILYLKMNERFWDLNDITAADHQHQRVNSRANSEADGSSSNDEE